MKFSTALAAAGFVLAMSAGTAAPKTEAAPAFVPIDPFAQVAEMGCGVNVLGYDPVWSDPTKGRFTPAMFAKIRAAGFSNVRIVLQTFEHMDKTNKLDAKWLKTLDTMVKAALDAGLTVVLDEHDVVLHSELVPEIKNEPDYAAAMAAL